MEHKFWLVWSADTKGAADRHTAFKNVVVVVERASVLNPGIRFYVGEALGYGVTGR